MRQGHRTGAVTALAAAIPLRGIARKARAGDRLLASITPFLYRNIIELLKKYQNI
jgi:hypothetical protein